MTLAPLRSKRVVVMPDIYTDAVCPLPAWPEASRRMGTIASRGGGNLPVGPIRIKAGGNAANLALALAHLGAEVDLIAATDAIGRDLVARAAAGTRLNLDRVRVGATGSTTLALECDGANVMLSHAGPLAGFGPQRLETEDWERITQADAVAVVNWAQNQQGTELLSAVARRKSPATFLYFDAGDPRHRGPDARQLVRPAAWWTQVNAFGMNQNELEAFSGRSIGPDELESAAEALAQRLGTRIDFHCRAWAASVTTEATVRSKAFGRPGRRATGAGDAWNAGNLAGQLLGLDARKRLRLAHRVATLYVTGPDGMPPDAAAVVRPVRRATAEKTLVVPQ